MKVIIAGSRTLPSGAALVAIVDAANELEDITEIISGEAKGVDLYGEAYANARGITIKRFPAEWEKHGRAAGPIRNAKMAENADALILVWDGKSRGSASMKREAEKHGLRIVERII